MDALAVIASYLLGSISFSYLLARWLKGIDIRNHGSGNAGATNTLRVLGKGPGLLVLLLDIGKGVAAVWLGRLIGGDNVWWEAACALAVIAGHNWPVYFGFKGGKGIATMIGALAAAAFMPTLLASAVAVLTIALTRYVSLGSLLLAAVLPVALAMMGREPAWIALSILLFLFAVLRHQANIGRLLRGEESKLGASKKEAAQ